MRRNDILLAMLLVVLLTMSGCSRLGRRARSTATPTRPPTQEAAAVQEPTATRQPTATQEAALPTATDAPHPTATVQPRATTASATATRPAAQASEEALPAPQADALQSYVAQIEVKEEQIEPSAKVVTWVTMETRYQGEPEPGAYAMVITNKADPAAGDQIQTIMTGADVYILSPEEGKWLKAPLGSSGLAAMTETMLDPNRLAETAPAGVFTQVNVVDAHEQVDGVDTTHYRVEGESFDALLRSAGSDVYQALGGRADFWVANGEGYLKQYRLDAQVQDAEQRELQQTATMLVTEENTPVQVDIPQPDQIIKVPLLEVTAEAPEANAHRAELEELPAPPDGSSPLVAEDLSAAVQGLFQGYLTSGQASRLYLSDASQEEIAQFYAAELPKLGWTELISMPGNTAGKRDMRLYEREGLNLLVAIVTDQANDARVVLLQIE